MKKSLIALAFLAASAVSSAAYAVREVAAYCVSGARRSWRWLVDMVLAPPATGAAIVRTMPGPAVALIAAKQFLMRQIKRERPQLSPSWRMCPSS